MTKGRFLLFLAVTIALLPYAATMLVDSTRDQGFFSTDAVSAFVVSVCMILIMVLAVTRCEAAGFSIVWLAPVFLWLAVSEPFFRALSGATTTASNTSVLSTTCAVFLMLLMFLSFMGLRDRPVKGQPRLSKRLEWVAAGMVAVSILLQPVLVMQGINNMPVFGELVDWPVWLTRGLVDIQNTNLLPKGLLPGLGVIGNGIFVAAFALVLFGMWLVERIDDQAKPVQRDFDAEKAEAA